MNHKIIYLDHSASTPIHPLVWKEMEENYCHFGNPSSIHQLGQKANYLLNKYRQKIATLLNCETDEIVFTSGATESNNFILQGIAKKQKTKPHFIISPLEHPSIINTALALATQQKINLDIVPVSKSGIIEIAEIKKLIQPTTKLISITSASSEIGTIQPISAIAKLAAESRIFFHTDLTQIISVLKIDIKKEKFSAASLSAQKIYGPKGIGLLYLKRKSQLDPLIHGGSQEQNLRAGTENLLAVVGLAKALEICFLERENYCQKMISLSLLLDQQINQKIPTAKLTGDKTRRLCFHRSYILQNCKIEQILMQLDLKGICVSSGSACNSGNKTPNFVLEKMGYSSEEATNSLRVSLGNLNNREQIIFFVDKLAECLENNKK